ncbi:MAG: phage portal protein, partial [Gemmataceae bacterium]|nr:phage portal protein [Gemmataceae bacterium]
MARAPLLLDHTGKPFPRKAPSLPRVRARYDAAQTSEENRRHWSNADSLGAKSATDPGVRQKLRDRARYETANNSSCRGMVLTLANDLIGTGPRLQLQTGSREVNRRIETAFGRWAKAARLAEKLRTIKQAKTVDGEAFALLVTNPALSHPVKLDLRLLEAEQVADPTLVQSFRPDEWDGIRLDVLGNPTHYHFLREHPGDSIRFLNLQGDWIQAEFVIHWFRADRPGQIRGVPELTPALPLFALLRRWTLACLAGAETAANFAAVLYNEAGADEEEQPTPFSTQEIERGMLAAMPMGWKLEQLRAEQPV